MTGIRLRIPHSTPIIQRCYSRFLADSNDLEDREYPDDADQIREVLIHGNYLSQKDIEFSNRRIHNLNSNR